MRLTALWTSLLVMGAAGLLGPATAFADERGGPTPQPEKISDPATVYEVAEWGNWVPPFVAPDERRGRQATATLVGMVAAGDTICPKKLIKGQFCDLVILASDDIRLATGRGPVKGDFWVVKQLEEGDSGSADGPEGIILEGKLFDGTVDLGPAFGGVPIGFLVGRWEAKGKNGGPLDGYKASGEVRGTFLLPFVAPPLFPDPHYMVNPALFPNPACCELVLPAEYSLGVSTVRLELSLTRGH